MLQSYQNNFVREHIVEFIELIDENLGLKGKLKEVFDVKKVFDFIGDEDPISFVKFYEVFSDWMIQ